MATESVSKSKKFTLLPFIYQNVASLLFIFALLKLFVPDIWAAQISASWQLLVVAFVIVHLFNAFVEYFFHRYVLHVPVIPFFSHFYKQHTLHHKHTRVVREGMYVHNIYPIEQEFQYEASFFPWYTMLFFSACYTPLFVLIYVVFPAFPIFIAGYSAMLVSIALYEFFHAAFHWPLTVWNPLFTQKHFGDFWKAVYAFHLRHHANIRCNESISGFLGIPIPDLLFKTYTKSSTLYPHNRMVDSKEFDPPKHPVFFITLLDKILRDRGV